MQTFKFFSQEIKENIYSQINKLTRKIESDFFLNLQ